jgi:hypothetical protein
MGPDAVLRQLVNASIRGAVYRILWRSPAAVSWIIVGAAVMYVVFGGHH